MSLHGRPTYLRSDNVLPTKASCPQRQSSPTQGGSCFLFICDHSRWLPSVRGKKTFHHSDTRATNELAALTVLNTKYLSQWKTHHYLRGHCRVCGVPQRPMRASFSIRYWHRILVVGAVKLLMLDQPIDGACHLRRTSCISLALQVSVRRIGLHIAVELLSQRVLTHP